MPDLSRRNVNMIFHRVLFTASVSLLCHMRSIICEIFICTLSMLSHPDETWKVHRKSLNYSFNMKILQSFIPIFIENAQKLCSDLSENLGKKQQFDMLTYTSHSALNMICGEWTWWWITSLPCRRRKKRSKTAVGKRVKKTFVDRARSYLNTVVWLHSWLRCCLGCLFVLQKWNLYQSRARAFCENTNLSSLTLLL